jgi:hypothetical protein
MSVLVREAITRKLYIFVKGNPEIIHDYSIKKLDGFDKLIQRLSFSGFRTIGFGYSEVEES